MLPVDHAAAAGTTVPAASSDRRALFAELWLAAFRQGGQGRLRATGRCMLPRLRSGQEIAIERCSGADCRVGDVVVYRGREGLVAHRVVGAFASGGERRLVHKGDNSRAWSIMPADSVLGRVPADGGPGPIHPDHPLARYYAHVGHAWFLAGRLVAAVRRTRRSVKQSGDPVPIRYLYAVSLLLPRLWEPRVKKTREG